MKKFLITSVLFFSASVCFGANIFTVQTDHGFLYTTLAKIWKCNVHPSCYSSPLFGTTITTINGTDKLSDSRVVINTNFSSLNSGKIENSTTSVNAITTLTNLVSIGTITTGVWNATAIPVAYGGTGTTSPSLNQIILGNTISGFKTVSGYGSSGQFLTSNGLSVAPTWQTSSVDQAGTYVWTGSHTFATSTTYISNVGVVNATSSINMNGVELTRYRVLSVNSTTAGTSATATTTLISYTLPASTMSTTRQLRITSELVRTAYISGVCHYQIDFGTGSATSTVGYSRLDSSSPNEYYGTLEAMMFATSTNNQLIMSHSVTASPPVNGGIGNQNFVNGTLTSASSFYGNTVTTINLANVAYIAFRARDSTGGATCSMSESIELLQ